MFTCFQSCFFFFFEGGSSLLPAFQAFSRRGLRNHNFQPLYILRPREER